MKALSKRNLLLVMTAALFFASCQSTNPNWKVDTAQPEYLHRSLQQITDVIVHDIFSPPVASRIYIYCSIAAYEAMVPGAPDYQSLVGQVNGLENVPQPEAGQEYCYPLAGVKAMLVVGKQLIFSEEKMDEFEKQILADFQKVQMPSDVYARSLAYGEAVGKHIIQWSSKDNYAQTRTFPKYTITDEEKLWKPTPPDYMDAVEPHWNKIRCFTLDSSAQFKPAPPHPYNMTEGSDFYKDVMAVYEALKVDEKERTEREAIARFWDCNPYVSHHKGHVMFATKKITPGGHWMGITKIACQQSKADIMKSLEAYVMVSLALADGFISCWDEKYRSQVVRPETVINAKLDPDWTPLLQTPPFPEYTSGHSVISTAAATALTHVFGDNFAYTDTVELRFGFPARSYTSFKQASQEAAVSRLYGGIHYPPACEAGKAQGAKVGEWVVSKIKMSKGVLSEK